MKFNKDGILEYVKRYTPSWVKILPVVFIFVIGLASIYQYGENKYQQGKIDTEAMYIKTSAELADKIRVVEGTVLTQFRESRKGLKDILDGNNAEIRALLVDKECVSEDFKSEYNKRLKR